MGNNLCYEPMGSQCYDPKRVPMRMCRVVGNDNGALGDWSLDDPGEFQPQLADTKAFVEALHAARRRPQPAACNGVSLGKRGPQHLLEEGQQLAEVVANGRVRLGPRHPRTLTSISKLGVICQELGRAGEAERLLTEALTGQRATLGNRHPETLASVCHLGLFYMGEGMLKEAEPLLQEALWAARETADGVPDGLLSCISNLGLMFMDQGQLNKAEPLLIQALAGSRQLGGHHETLKAIQSLCFLYQGQGRLSEAEPLLEEALATKRRLLGSRHPETLASIERLAQLYMSMGTPEKAEHLFREALAITRGTLLADRGKFDEAEPLFKEVLDERHPRHSHETQEAVTLCRSFMQRGKLAEAQTTDQLVRPNLSLPGDFQTRRERPRAQLRENERGLDSGVCDIRRAVRSAPDSANCGRRLGPSASCGALPSMRMTPGKSDVGSFDRRRSDGIKYRAPPISARCEIKREPTLSEELEQALAGIPEAGADSQKSEVPGLLDGLPDHGARHLEAQGAWEAASGDRLPGFGSRVNCRLSEAPGEAVRILQRTRSDMCLFDRSAAERADASGESLATLWRAWGGDSAELSRRQASCMADGVLGLPAWTGSLPASRRGSLARSDIDLASGFGCLRGKGPGAGKGSGDSLRTARGGG